MEWWKKIWDKISKDFKFSASDPANFIEIWSFQSTILRLISLFIIFLLLFSALIIYLFVAGPFSGYFSTNDVPIEREKLENQNRRIAELTEKVQSQEEYLSNITRILEGKDLELVTADSLSEVPEIDYDAMNDKMTDAERTLLEKINEDIRSVQKNDEQTLVFASPVHGEISQEFNKSNHPGIDIVTGKQAEVKSCQRGTVIYAGFSRKDGYMLIIDHGNGFLSVYKHNLTVFKQPGDKVQLGDPIAIVGNSGENTNGPHLHFELWHNQKPVDPKGYMSFKN